MKSILFLILCCVPLAGEEPDVTTTKRLAAFTELQNMEWLSFSMTLHDWKGDYWNHGPTVLVQKSVDGSIIISWSGDTPSEQPPIVARILSINKGGELRTKLLETFRKAIVESAHIKRPSEDEIAAYEARTGHTPTYSELEIRITRPDLKTETMRTRLGIDPEHLRECAYYKFAMLVNDFTPKTSSEQAAPGQSATRPESKPEGNQKPQPKSEGQSR